MACFLIHNFIRTTNAIDPEEQHVPEDHEEDTNPPIVEAYVDNVDASTEWTNWRDNLAHDMYNAWLNR